jgi:hypothetical protein
MVLLLLLGIVGAGPMEWFKVSPDNRGFVRDPSGRPFAVRGFNYDHDESGRLLEDYWEAEWPKVESDFREMKELGANVVRIHLQTGKFLRGPGEADPAALNRLKRLLDLAEACGLYLDLTGLGCYHKHDVPPWYDALSEELRWAAQARFWEAIAECCANSPAIFCYDLMNEPVVAGNRRDGRDWLAGAFAGKHFVQFINLEPAGRSRSEIARRWIETLVAAIRRNDRRHLVTVGLVDWSLERPGLSSGFVPREIAAQLDFVSVHIYPERGKVPDALATLRGFSIGKPVIIEETFPLKCSGDELKQFLIESRTVAAGWIGFYWGKSRAECLRSGTIGDALTAGWLEVFAQTR